MPDTIALRTPARSRRKPRLRVVSGEPAPPLRACLLPSILAARPGEVVVQLVTLAEWDAIPPGEAPEVVRYLPGVGILIVREPASRLELEDIRDQVTQAKEDHATLRDRRCL